MGDASAGARGSRGGWGGRDGAAVAAEPAADADADRRRGGLPRLRDAAHDLVRRRQVRRPVRCVVYANGARAQSRLIRSARTELSELSVYFRHLLGGFLQFTTPPPTAAKLCALNHFFGRTMNYKYVTETFF